MTQTSKIAAFMAALSLLALSPASHAANWQLNYTGTSSVWGADAATYALPVLQLNIVTADVLSNSQLGQGYQVTAMTGTRNGQAITAVFTPGSDPFFSFGIDPYVYPDSEQILSFTGLGYRTADGIGYNLYGSTGGLGPTPEVQWFEIAQLPSTNPSSSFVIFQGDLSLTQVTAVPEPSSWALMLGGVALFAGVARSRRSTAVPQA